MEKDEENLMLNKEVYFKIETETDAHTKHKVIINNFLFIFIFFIRSFVPSVCSSIRGLKSLNVLFFLLLGM